MHTARFAGKVQGVVVHIATDISAVVLAENENSNWPTFSGLSEAAQFSNTAFTIFGKPTTRPFRRMAVALAYGNENTSVLVEKAKQVATKIKVD